MADPKAANNHVDIRQLFQPSSEENETAEKNLIAELLQNGFQPWQSKLRALHKVEEKANLITTTIPFHGQILLFIFMLVEDLSFTNKLIEEIYLTCKLPGQENDEIAPVDARIPHPYRSLKLRFGEVVEWSNKLMGSDYWKRKSGSMYTRQVGPRDIKPIINLAIELCEQVFIAFGACHDYLEAKITFYHNHSPRSFDRIRQGLPSTYQERVRVHTHLRADAEFYPGLKKLMTELWTFSKSELPTTNKTDVVTTLFGPLPKGTLYTLQRNEDNTKALLGNLQKLSDGLEGACYWKYA